MLSCADFKEGNKAEICFCAAPLYLFYTSDQVATWRHDDVTAWFETRYLNSVHNIYDGKIVPTITDY